MCVERAKSSFVRCRKLCAVLVWAALVGASPAPASAQWVETPGKSTSTGKVDVIDMDLLVGEQRVIPSDNVRSYSEGAKGIVDVRLTKDATQFIVVGLSPGTTTLLFILMDGSERHYRITVSDPNTMKRPSGFQESVAARDNIRLDFYFVQLSKNYAHQIGIGWPGSVAPTFSATYNAQTGMLDSATAVIADQPLPRLDMAQTSGWAKVLRQAAVVTANGEKAQFAGGGEVNVLVQTALATGIQKIPFGAIIEVEPRYDSSTGRIELRIHADISELESDRGTGVPGRMTAALDTIVNLELGQSIILAGLTARTKRRSKTGLPGLSQIPLIGVFFGSHQQAEEESENVVVIVPSVVDAVSMQDRERLNYALDVYREYSGSIEGVKFVPEAKPNARTGKP